MPKKIWRKNFEIKKTDYQLAQALESFYIFQDKTVDKKYLKDGIWIVKNGDNIGTYMIKNELRGLIGASLEVFLKNPNKIINILKRTENYNDKYFKEAEVISKLNLNSLSDKNLINLYNKLFKLYQLSHGYSLPITWFIDSDNEDLTSYLLNFTKIKLKENHLRINPAKTFSILTSPTKESLSQKEEIESLEILKLIKSDKKIKKIFNENDIKKIKAGLDLIRPDIKIEINRHFKKWRWFPYTYVGPTYNLDHYLGIWSSQIQQNVSPVRELNKFKKAHNDLKKERSYIIKKLNLDKKIKKYFDNAAYIVWLKGYRKDVLYHGFYVQDMILKELGKRYYLSLIQMKHLLRHELYNLKKIKPEKLNQRKKFSVLYGKNGKIKVYTGKTAKNFLKKQTFEKEKIKNTSTLKGTPACPGKAEGKVKIINLPSEMGKMKKGDIMVAHTTFPALVPAMKKASAIVTDDGGLTCHAAIVARELKIPCIVGTKFATKVLKDKYNISVNASDGIIKKL